MQAERYIPDEELRLQTRRLVRSAEQQRTGRNPRIRKHNLLYYPAVAVVLAVILVFSVFPGTPAQAAGYYTIDINPSIIVAVDDDDTVLFFTAKNKEAKELMTGVGLTGMRFDEALKVVINAASQKGYLKQGGHLLVAHFGDSEGISQQALEEIVADQLPESGVVALALNGGKDKFEKAKKAGQKPGIELLMDGAREAGIRDKDIDVVIDKMSDKPGKAPDGQKNKIENKDNNGNSGKAEGNSGNNSSGSNSAKGKDSAKKQDNAKGNSDKEKDREKDNDKGKNKDKGNGKGN